MQLSLGVDGLGGPAQLLGGELMALELVNLAKSVLDGGIDDSVTSFDVADASDFPSDGVFWVGVGEGAVPDFPAELMKVTGVSSNTFTVERGVSPTTGQSHSSGAEVSYTLTAEAFTQLRADITRQGTYAEMDALTDMKSGDVFYPDGTDTPYDRFVYNGTAWIPYYDGYKCTPFIAADFTWVNQGTSSIASVGGATEMSVQAGTNNFRILKKAAPATPYTITVLAQLQERTAATQAVGIGWRENATGELHVWYCGRTLVRIQKWNSPTSYSADYGSATDQFHTKIWLRITHDGTSRITYWSRTGHNWEQLTTVTDGDFLTSDEVFLAGIGSNGAYFLQVLSWEET